MEASSSTSSSSTLELATAATTTVPPAGAAVTDSSSTLNSNVLFAKLDETLQVNSILDKVLLPMLHNWRLTLNEIVAERIMDNLDQNASPEVSDSLVAFIKEIGKDICQIYIDNIKNLFSSGDMLMREKKDIDSLLSKRRTDVGKCRVQILEKRESWIVKLQALSAMNDILKPDIIYFENHSEELIVNIVNDTFMQIHGVDAKTLMSEPSMEEFLNRTNSYNADAKNYYLLGFTVYTRCRRALSYGAKLIKSEYHDFIRTFLDNNFYDRGASAYTIAKKEIGSIV
jgi:hypothetical protein